MGHRWGKLSTEWRLKNEKNPLIVAMQEKKIPEMPSLNDQRKHYLTHLPHASWCKHFVVSSD